MALIIIIMMASKFIQLVFLVSSAAVAEIQTPRALYGGACSNTTRCDARARLMCAESKCDCLKPGEMVYDAELEKCVVKAGEVCMYVPGNGSDLLYEVDSCVQGAACSPDGICSCNPEFYETTEGTCAETKGHLQSCGDAIRCSTLKGLQCQDGHCQCDTSKSEFSSEHEQCVGLAGNQCIGAKCTANASCVTNVCVCDEGHYLDVKGKCVTKIPRSGNCSADFQCGKLVSQQLKCVRGTCDCDAENSVYASVRSAAFYNDRRFAGYVGQLYEGCVALESFPCHEGYCAPKSYCLYNNSPYVYPYDTSGICKCEPKHSPSRNHQCRRGFGQSCNSAEECFDTLVCKDRKCSCELNVQLFNSTTNTCYGGVRAPCTADEGCEANAVCQLTDAGIGHCTCAQGFVPNAADLCVVAEGGECTSTSECDSIASLECINGLCRCATFSDFHDEHRKCVGKVGAQCVVDEGNECVDHAECKRTHPKLPASCTCEEGFFETKNYSCMLANVHDES